MMQMNYDTFLEKLKTIEEEGFVKSHRSGPTGIGKTLEDKLGIKENCISGPDLVDHELKSARKPSRSMLTLFTKTPQPKGAIRNLLEAYGYPHRKGKSGPAPGELELHSTIDSSRKNSHGLILEVRGNRLYIVGVKNVEAFYDKELLKTTFEKKYNNLVYVLADHKKVNKVEYFHYNEAYRMEDFAFERFIDLVNRGHLKVDLRVGHYQNGRLRDHGTAFRIPSIHLKDCFETIEKIL